MPGSVGAAAAAAASIVRDLDEEEFCKTPRTYEAAPTAADGGGAGLDPADPGADPLAPTVKTMRSFWETRWQEPQQRPSSVDGGGGSRRGSLHELRDSSLSRRGAGGRGSTSSTSRHAKSMRRLRHDMARQWKLQEQIADKIRTLGASDGDLALQRSSDSESEAPPGDDVEALMTCRGDEDEEEINALRLFEETSKSLWRAQRQTMRLLLRYVERNKAIKACKGQEGCDGASGTAADAILSGANAGLTDPGLAAAAAAVAAAVAAAATSTPSSRCDGTRRGPPGGASAVGATAGEPEPHEPAGEPEVSDAFVSEAVA